MKTFRVYRVVESFQTALLQAEDMDDAIEKACALPALAWEVEEEDVISTDASEGDDA